MLLILFRESNEYKLFNRAAVIAAKASDCLLAILTVHLGDNLHCYVLNRDIDYTVDSWHIFLKLFFSRKKENFKVVHEFDNFN